MKNVISTLPESSHEKDGSSESQNKIVNITHQFRT